MAHKSTVEILSFPFGQNLIRTDLLEIVLALVGD